MRDDNRNLLDRLQGDEPSDEFIDELWTRLDTAWHSQADINYTDSSSIPIELAVAEDKERGIHSRRRLLAWAGAAAAAAAIAVIIGVRVFTADDGESGVDITTVDQPDDVIDDGTVNDGGGGADASSVDESDDVVDDGSADDAPDAALPQSVVDPVLGYRWSRVARESGYTAVTTGGPGLVAVGSVSSDDDSAAAVWTSVDGFTWSLVPYDEAIFGGGAMESVTIGGPGLVAVGSVSSDDDSAAAVWTSVDGITWSRVSHDEAVFGGGWMVGVAAGGPGLVAVGSVSSDDDSEAAAWTSVDAVTWFRVPHDEVVFGDGVAMASVTAGGPGFVAVGGSGPHENGAAAVWTSADGMSWSRVPHDEVVFGGGGEQWMTSVTAGGPGLVAVGWELNEFGNDADAAVWTSADGITWSRVPHDEEVFGGPSYQGMWGLTAGGPGVVAVGSSRSSLAEDSVATVWSSLDGITWSRVLDPEAVLGIGDMNSVTSGGPGLVAVGDTVWVAALEE